MIKYNFQTKYLHYNTDPTSKTRDNLLFLIPSKTSIIFNGIEQQIFSPKMLILSPQLVYNKGLSTFGTYNTNPL